MIVNLKLNTVALFFVANFQLAAKLCDTSFPRAGSTRQLRTPMIYHVEPLYIVISV